MNIWDFVAIKHLCKHCMNTKLNVCRHSKKSVKWKLRNNCIVVISMKFNSSHVLSISESFLSLLRSVKSQIWRLNKRTGRHACTLCMFKRTKKDLLRKTLDIMTVEDIHKNNVLTFVNMCLMGNAQKYSISIIKWKPHHTKQDRKAV